MLLQYLLVGIIFYYIVKTSGKLMQAIRGGMGDAPHDPRFDPRSRSPRSGSEPQWRDDSGRSADRSSARWDDDIEDAKWEDL